MIEVKDNIKVNTKTKKENKNLLSCYIIRDTRESEEHGWKFENLPSNLVIDKICDDGLEAGDYTIVGWDMQNDTDSIIIERKKSLEEFCGNIGTNWERFERELEILSKYKNAYILIEDDFHNIYQRYKGRFSYVNLSPDFILSRIADIQIRFNISTYFLTNTYYAQRFALNLFKNILLKEKNSYGTEE